jgi:hypothetical protein
MLLSGAVKNELLGGGLFTEAELTKLENSEQAALNEESIRQLYIGGYISREQLSIMTFASREVMKQPELREFFLHAIASNITDMDKIVRMSDDARYAFENPDVRYFIKTREDFTIDNIFNIKFSARKVLTSYGICQLVNLNYISYSDITNVSLSAAMALQDEEIFNFCIANLQAESDAISVDDIIGMSPYVCRALKSANIRDLVTDGLLTYRQLMDLSGTAVLGLKRPAILDLFKSGKLNYAQLCALTQAARTAFIYPEQLNFLLTSIEDERCGINMDQVVSMSPEAGGALASQDIRTLVADGLLTYPQLLSISPQAKAALRNSDICHFIRAAVEDSRINVDMERFLQLNVPASRVLKYSWARALLTDEVFTYEQFLQLRVETEGVFQNEDALALLMAAVATNDIDKEQVLQISMEASLALCNPDIRSLVRDHIVTWPQIFDIDREHRLALTDADIQARLRAGEVAFDYILHDPAAINPAQSTHTASVHQSSSESAVQLMRTYGSKLYERSVEDVAQEIRTVMLNLSPQLNEDLEEHEGEFLEKCTIAQACLLRLTERTPDNQYRHNFQDPGSSVYNVELLVLAYLAICDDAKRIGKFSDAFKLFIEGLCEIQRGYNANPMLRDGDDADDRPICAAGTFNKFIEKLQGIHPFCNIRYITKATASVNLKRAVVSYLAELATPQTKQELFNFVKLISALSADYFEETYAYIKPAIAERMYMEFGSCYQGKDDPAFVALIDAGKYADFDDPDRYKQQIESSPGYHHYSSYTLRSSIMFFSSRNQRMQHNAVTVAEAQTFEPTVSDAAPSPGLR